MLKTLIRQGRLGLILLTFMLGWLGPEALLAQTGSLTGSVTARSTGEPLIGAQIVIPQLQMGTVTGSGGHYQLAGIPVGNYEVQVIYLGYAPVKQAVTVTEAEATRLQFSLALAAIDLDEIVVTGTGAPTERRQLGQTIAAVTAKDLERAPITNVSQALQGRIPGLVGAGLGETGSAAVIRLRGTVSLTQRNEPIIYIDGIRVDNSQNNLGGITTSRLNDIDPSNIDRIEVLKGAAAATLFGTEASSGVIQIFTKRGLTGDPVWTFQMDQQVLKTDQSRIPTNYGYDPASRQIMSNRPGDDYIKLGHHQNYSVSVRGGTPSVRYSAAGRIMAENGTFPNNTADNKSLRTSLDFQHGSKLSSRTDISIVRSTITAPYPTWGLLGEFVLANPANTSSTRPYGEQDHTVAGALAYSNTEDADNRVLSGALEYAWSPDFTSTATVGLNSVGLKTVRFIPAGAGIQIPGERAVWNRNTSSITLDFKNALNVRLNDQLTSTITFGGQSYWEDLRTEYVRAIGFPSPALKTLRGAATVTDVDEFKSEVINAGLFAQGQLGISNRLFVTVGARVDGNSAFGKDFGFQTYPKVGASWVLSDEEFWSVDMIPQVRLRAAYGTSGLQPGAFDAQRTWRPASLRQNNPAVLPLNLGNPDLRPERSSERELGVELGMFGGRLGLDVVYYDQKTVDALLPRRGPPSQGFTEPQLTNIGALKSDGLEVSTNLLVFNGAQFRWTLDASYTKINQMVTDMGDVAPFRLGTQRRRSTIIEGFAPGVVIDVVADPKNPYILSVPVEDLTSLDQIQPNFLKASNGQDSLAYVGDANPSWTVSLSSAFDLPHNLHLRALFTGAGGFVIVNETELIRESVGYNQSAAQKKALLADPNTTKAQKQAIVDEYGNKHPAVVSSWAEDGTYLKLSELSLGYELPATFANRLGLGNTAVTISATNLFLWTGYSGIIDPGGGQARFGEFLQNIDYFGAPTPRRFALGIRTSL